MKNALKALLGIVATVALFLLFKNALGNPSSMPQLVTDSYAPSFLALRGLENLGYLGLITAVLLHYIATARRIGRSLESRPVLAAFVRRGLPVFQILGFTYGLIWFVAFLELGFVFYARMDARCVLSGLRDLLTLTASGFIFSRLFAATDVTIATDSTIATVEAIATVRSANPRPRRGLGDFLVIPCAAAGFFALHILQYRLVFTSVPTRALSVGGIAWLAFFGLLIGAFYYLFAGRSRRPVFLAADFFLNVFGCNWLLYNLFYNPALDIPFWEILIRSGSGAVGGLLGASVYYLARRALS